eukprot:scaffold16982_cov91-Skeletonema_dohrnii-CCMP3373.AAC.6
MAPGRQDQQALPAAQSLTTRPSKRPKGGTKGSRLLPVQKPPAELELERDESSSKVPRLSLTLTVHPSSPGKYPQGSREPTLHIIKIKIKSKRRKEKEFRWFIRYAYLSSLTYHRVRHMIPQVD